MPMPDFLLSLANPATLLGWALLVLTPHIRFTKVLMLNGSLPLGLVAAHYLGPHGGTGGFGSLGQVAALIRDPWALLAGWVYYLCFDLFTDAWETRNAQRRGLPHALVVPTLALTFLFGPVSLLLYFGLHRLWIRKTMTSYLSTD